MSNGRDDLRLSATWLGHVKTKRLIRDLGPEGALGLLGLWSYAALNHPDDGVLPAEDMVEDAAGWTGEPGALVAALKRHGWLESDGRTIHDWTLEQPWLSHKAERVAQARAAGSEGGKASWSKRSALGPPKRNRSGRFGVAEAEPNLLSPTPAPAPTPTPPTNPPASEADAPVSTAKKASKKRASSDPLAAELRKRIGCYPEPAKNQITALRAAGWDDPRIQAAIDAHAEPGLAPWDWTKRARAASAPPSMPLTKPNGSLTAAGIIANGKLIDANPNLFAAFKKLPPGGTDGSR